MTEIKFAEQVGKVRMFVAQGSDGRYWANVGIEGHHPDGGWVMCEREDYDKATWPEAVVDMALQVLEVPDQYLFGDDGIKERIAETIQRLMAKFPVAAPGPGQAYSVMETEHDWFEYPIDALIARTKVEGWADWLIEED